MNPSFFFNIVSLYPFSLMDCKKKTKTNNKCNHKSAKYLEPPKGILVSFCPLCSESCVGTLGESFLLFIGVLLRLASCLFCMVFAKKCLLREESFTFFFFVLLNYLFATLDLKRSPPLPVPSFLNSLFCMLHLEPAHRAISPVYNKELFLCQ